jgi:hypothetical protein
MTTLSVLAAVAVSAALLVLLALGDPKRRRTAGTRDGAQGTTVRRLLAVASLLPGIACIANGDAAAFLIWFGGCAVAGWFVTLALAQGWMDSR